MDKIKPLPIDWTKFISTIKAFEEFSKQTGIKVKLIVEFSTGVEKKEMDSLEELSGEIEKQHKE